MKRLQKTDIDYQLLENKVRELKTLLDTKDAIKENTLLAFFKQRPELLCIIGEINLRVSESDLYASEFDIFGYFRADFVVGNSKKGRYLLIELESAENNIFYQRAQKSKREWHRVFSIGYNQLFDWFWLLEDFEHTLDFQNTFPNFSNFTGLLIIGRNKYLTGEEKRRIEWRQNKSLFDSNRILLMTYDELYEDLENYINALREATDVS